TRPRPRPRFPRPRRIGASEMATAAERLAEFSTSVSYEQIPDDVVEAAKLHLLDTVGCGLAAHALGVATEGRAAMAELGGEPQASVIGLEGALPAPNAAFANAMLCHGLDFDDPHSDSVSHLFAYRDAATATKPLHPAWAAHGAVLAARLAGLGAEGPPGVIEGRFGLYHAFVGAAKGELPIDEEIDSLGERWETPRIAYKPYPACHFIHGSLGATASIVDGLDPAEIEDVVVVVPEAGVSLVLEPAAAKVA